MSPSHKVMQYGGTHLETSEYLESVVTRSVKCLHGM